MRNLLLDDACGFHVDEIPGTFVSDCGSGVRVACNLHLINVVMLHAYHVMFVGWRPSQHCSLPSVVFFYQVSVFPSPLFKYV